MSVISVYNRLDTIAEELNDWKIATLKLKWKCHKSTAENIKTVIISKNEQ
jgi:hypothetical protein